MSARRWWRIGAVILATGCGGDTDGPDTLPPGPGTSTPGGTVAGSYVFRLEAAAECRPPRASVSVRVTATPTTGGRRPGVQILQEGASVARAVDTDFAKPLLEMELLYEAPNLQGSIGTLPDDVDWEMASWIVSAEGVPVSIHGIGVASVATESAGVGEVQQGTLVGDVAFERGRPCFSTQHRWSLRVR